jgi:hypothetical protein
VNRKLLFLVTAAIEAGTGLLLLVVPAVPLALLLGSTEAAPETLLVGRVTGAALFTIGVSCWLAREDKGSPAQRGVLVGILVYDAAAALLLVYAGAVLKMAGLALWPAVTLHVLLAAWCVVEWLAGNRP